MAALLAALCALASATDARAILPLANASGEALYLRECAPCHGPTGHGDGSEAATFRNTPRDLRDLASAEPSPRIVERVRRSRLRMIEIDEDVVVEQQKRIVGDLVAWLQRMPDVPWSQVHRGADVYAERCEKCHGPNGRPVAASVLQRAAQPGGRAPAPDFQKAHGDERLIAVAQGQGHPATPGFTPVLSEDDAYALVAYLRNLSDGLVAYSLWCAGCHGDEGKGDGPLASGIDKPPVVFNHVYMASQPPEELRRKAMHLFSDVEPAAPHFQRNLSEGQTRAVLAAVRVLQTVDGGAAPSPGGTAARAATPRAGAPTPAAPAASPVVPAQMPAAVATMHAPGAAAATPGPSPSSTSAGQASSSPAPPASITPAPSRTPAAKAAVKAVKPRPTTAKAPAKKPVKPKATPKPAKRAKPKTKPTPAKKAAAPRPTATAEPVLAP